MPAIAFETNNAIDRFVPGRMDVACFVGFVAKRSNRVIPAAVVGWWQQQGWVPNAREYGDEDGYALPIPVDSWENYTALFAEQRNDHRAQVLGSRALQDPIPLADDDRDLQLLVDHHRSDSAHSFMTISIEPGDDGSTVSFASLLGQLNNQLHGATASMQMVGNGGYLVIERNDDVNAGELTVYANPSLGFTEPQQDDVFALPNPMSAAVGSFFQQGGRKCYVIPLGVPLPMMAADERRIARLLTLIWGKKVADGILGDAKFKRDELLAASLPMIEAAVTPHALSSSLALVLTLNDATYLSLPDLVDLLGFYEGEDPGEELLEVDETFIECSETELVPPRYYLQRYPAPVCGETDYKIWGRLVFRILEFLTLHAPTTQFVTSLPLPNTYIRGPIETYVTRHLLKYNDGDDKYYRRLQLAFPWLRTHDSQDSPQQLLAPEGSLLGLLARNALVQGAYRSIAGSIHDTAYDLYPRNLNLHAPASDDDTSDPQNTDPDTGITFQERVNCFDFVPNGIALLSDVTADPSPYHRYAVVRRIMMLVQRAAYQLGLSHVFETSGSALWRSIEGSLSSLLLNIYQHQGLRGRTSADAFSVTCDRTTMTQADIDNGRLIARIEFQPAVPVEKITVALALDNDGIVALGRQS